METIKLKCGTEVDIDSIYITRTYTCLLEGRPNKKVNDWEIEKLIRDAQKIMHINGKPYLEPPQYSMERGFPELPSYGIAILLSSYMPVHNSQNHCSDAIVIWYQNDSDYFSDDFRALMKKLVWKDIAYDGLY